MPRKATRKKRQFAPNRVAKTHVTPGAGLYDVLRLIQFETWLESGHREAYKALLCAVFAVLAACARVRPHNATLLLLDAYRAGKLEVLGMYKGRHYPVILLPVAVAVIEAYLAKRRELGIGGVHLLVDEKGERLTSSRIYLMFDQFSVRCGHSGGKTVGRLIEFHDGQLEKENRDPAACVALRRGRRSDMDRDVLWRDIDAAKADRERLTKVLERNHVLAGDAERWIGPRARTEARENARLFVPRKVVRKLSPAVMTDPVCRRLREMDWLGAKKPDRAKIVKEDLPHLVRLRDDGLITYSDINYLLNCHRDTTKHHVRKYRAAMESEEDRQARQQREAEWHSRVIALHQRRPEGEGPRSFFDRIVREEGYPFEWTNVVASLQAAKLLPRQVERQQQLQVGRRAPGAKTREDYLANSLTSTAPWKEAGISRRTWERRRKQTARGAVGED